MTESLPRWGLPEVDFLTTDAATIKSEIITQYETTSGRSLAAGDPVRLFLLSIASIIIQQRNAINSAARQNLLSYAQGQYLDALGTYLSVTRQPAASAVATFEFTLSEALENNYVIPSGFEITNGVLNFATDEELIIPAGQTTGSTGATCTTPGEAGNGYVAGQISTIVSPLTFLEAAQNTTETAGGADIESDADFAERIRLAPNSFSVAGPKEAYLYNTLSVSSAIIDAAIISPTPGVVNVYPLMEDGEIPTQDVLDLVESHLSADDVRPLTDDVHVYSPNMYWYNINVDYWINYTDRAKADTIRANVEAAVEEYRVWQQSKMGRDISPGRLIANIINAGAAKIDYGTMQPNYYIELTAEQVAHCPPENVYVNYQGLKDD